MKDGFKFLCPCGDWSCPCYKKGACELGENAVNECDDAYYYCNGEDDDYENW